MPVPPSAPSTGALSPSIAICASMCTWRTMSCSRVPWSWSSRVGIMPAPAAEPALPLLGDTAAYERHLSRLLMAFLASGLAFLLGPGSFLGRWNLLGISQRHASLAISPAWLQAHGHAEVFGWVGSFILGIGFHSLTRQSGSRVAMGWAWACWALWSAGVALRWLAGVTAWRWRWTLPLAAAMELAAYWIFRSSLRRAHEKDSSEARARMPGWI